MTWRKRIGLIVGLIFVLALSAGLTMYVNNSNGKITGMSASLMATDYPVGTDYSGTITKQYVKVGDAVKPGQSLFEIESPILARDLAQGLVTKDSLSHELKGNNTLVITATNSGQVDSVAFTAGAFVPANSTIATVQQAGTMYVSADFVLTAKDYARLPTNATMDVLLPNNTTIVAKVSQLKVTTQNGEARTTVQAYSPDLAKGPGVFAVGTPVGTTLYLKNNGVVTDVTHTVTGWLGIK